MNKIDEAIQKAKDELLAKKSEIEKTIVNIESPVCGCGKSISHPGENIWDDQTDGILFHGKWFCWKCYRKVVLAFVNGICGS